MRIVRTSVLSAHFLYFFIFVDFLSTVLSVIEKCYGFFGDTENRNPIAEPFL